MVYDEMSQLVNIKDFFREIEWIYSDIRLVPSNKWKGRNWAVISSAIMMEADWRISEYAAYSREKSYSIALVLEILSATHFLNAYIIVQGTC